MTDQPVFYYDLADPDCYLVAERVSVTLPVVPEWEPVAGFPLPVRERERVERLASERGLMPLRWPARWPPDSALALRAARFAKGAGRVVAFSLACFRQTFAGGRELDDLDTILIAAAACEMHPKALLRGIELRSVIDGLEHAAKRARDAGVRSLPAIQAAGRVFEGEEGVEQAADALSGTPSR